VTGESEKERESERERVHHHNREHKSAKTVFFLRITKSKKFNFHILVKLATLNETKAPLPRVARFFMI
jgi:hypothetical protein